MPALTRLRGSSLPLLFECPASLHKGDDHIDISENIEASNIGRAAHAAMASIVKGSEPDLDHLAQRFNVDRDELGWLVWYGRKAWSALRPSFPDPEPEHAFKVDVPTGAAAPLVLTGHIDLRCRLPKRVHGLDWKFGRVDKNHYHQVAGYALGEMLLDPEVEEVVFTIVWLRDQDVETYVFSRAAINEWAAELVAQRDREKDFRTGPGCAYCPRSHACPALMAIAKRDVAMFTAGQEALDTNAVTPEKLVSELSGPEVARLLRRAKLVAKFAESLDGVVRQRVADSGDVIDIGDGKELRLIEEKGQRKVDTAIAWPVLQQFFPDEAAMAAVVTVKLGAAEKIISDNAPRGLKGKRKEEFGRALMDAGAISQGMVKKLREVRRQGEIQTPKDG